MLTGWESLGNSLGRTVALRPEAWRQPNLMEKETGIFRIVREASDIIV